MSSFEIGQLIYVVSNKTQTVLPGIIQEENRSRNLDGEVVSYKVLIGPPNSIKTKIFDLSKVDGEVYGSTEEVKEVMLKKFTEFLDGVCTKAQVCADEWYRGIISNKNQTNASTDEKVDPATIMNEINNSGSGTAMQPQYVQIQGNHAVPVGPMQPQNGMRQGGNIQQVRRQMQQSMMDGLGNPTHLVEMPDGSLKEVSININNPK